MRLIVDHRDFPFRRETRVARVVDVTILLLLTAVLVQGIRSRPAGPASAAPPDEGPVATQVVLSIHADGRWTVAGQLIPPADAEAELRRLFAGRQVKLLFIEAAPGRTYGEVLAAAERARAAGIATVGILPPMSPSSP